MAKLTPLKKLKIFQQLNMRGIPWEDSKFFIEDGDYNLLGMGSFSEVYILEDVENPEINYAVKIIGFSERSRISKAAINSYKNEIVLQKRLAENCHNIVKIIDTEVVSIQLTDDGDVMDIKESEEYVEKTGWLTLAMFKMEKLDCVVVEGCTGNVMLQPEGLFNYDEKEVLKLAIDIATALEASHNQSILHRDVKLENIFYDSKDKTYKLGDFGIARITSQGCATTRGAGTQGYEAPEVMDKSDEKYGYQADIYSFGITLYLIMNKLLFPGNIDYHDRSFSCRPDEEIPLPANGSEALKKYVCKMINYYPKNRPGSMTEVINTLKKIAELNNVLEIEPEADTSNLATESIKDKLFNLVAEPIKAEEPVEIPGDLVAETNSGEKKDKENNEKKDKEKEEIKPSLAKGILGIIVLLAGFVFFENAFDAKIQFADNILGIVFLAYCSLGALVAIVSRKFEKKAIPIWLVIIPIILCIIMFISVGIEWVSVVLLITLLLRKIGPAFAVSTGTLITMAINGAGLTFVKEICNPDWSWIVLVVVLYGLLWVMQLYNDSSMIAFFLGDRIVGPTFLGMLVALIGLVVWILDFMLEMPAALVSLKLILVGILIFAKLIVLGVLDAKEELNNAEN